VRFELSLYIYSRLTAVVGEFICMAHVALTVANGAHSVTVFEIVFNCQYLLVIIVTGTVCMSSDP
jgi:hypothetical protein